MLMIRFQRIGRTNDPAFRIVVLEKARAAKTGRVTEQLGTYNPRTKAFNLDAIKIKEWIAKGAQPSPSMHNFLITKGVIEGKKINVLSRKTPIKAEVAKAAPAPKTETSVESAPVIEVAAETPVEVPTV